MKRTASTGPNGLVTLSYLPSCPETPGSGPLPAPLRRQSHDQRVLRAWARKCPVSPAKLGGKVDHKWITGPRWAGLGPGNAAEGDGAWRGRPGAGAARLRSVTARGGPRHGGGGGVVGAADGTEPTSSSTGERTGLGTIVGTGPVGL